MSAVVFSQVAHITETHIFVLAGLIISDRFILQYDELQLAVPEHRLFTKAPLGFHIAMSVALYILLHMIRAIAIGMFMPLLTKLGVWSETPIRVISCLLPPADWCPMFASRTTQATA